MKSILILYLLFATASYAQSVDTLVIQTNMGDIKHYVIPSRGVFTTKLNINGNGSQLTGITAAQTGAQSPLVSGTNIKTVNGQPLLGSGDLVVGGATAWGSVTGTLSDQSDLQTALNTKLATNGDGSLITGLTKGQVGLGNADNTSDANKPVSSATTTALNLKANLASPTFTGTVGGVTASMVGLGNVNNTSDASKPVSTAQQTALDLKANLASPTFTGTVSGVTATMVGLGNVNNTSDVSKPISTATQTALDAKQATLVSNTNIKTVGGQTVLGSGNIATTNSQTFVALAANFSSVSTTPATVTGWSFAVVAGVTYRIEVIAAYQTAATTTGGIIGISLTGATGSVRGIATGTIVSTAAASDLTIPIVATSGAGSTLTTTGVTAINSPHYIGMTITFTCTGNGTFNIVWATEVAASASQLNQNSSLIYQALN